MDDHCLFKSSHVSGLLIFLIWIIFYPEIASFNLPNITSEENSEVGLTFRFKLEFWRTIEIELCKLSKRHQEIIQAPHANNIDEYLKIFMLLIKGGTFEVQIQNKHEKGILERLFKRASLYETILSFRNKFLGTSSLKSATFVI